MNSVDERSFNNRGGRLFPGMNFDRINSLISASDFEFKKPMRLKRGGIEAADQIQAPGVSLFSSTNKEPLGIHLG